MTVDRIPDARIRAGLPPVPSCSSCPRPAVGYTSWPDGTSVAWCTDHIDTRQQISITEGI